MGETSKTINSTNVLNCQSKVAPGKKTKLGKKIADETGETKHPTSI